MQYVENRPTESDTAPANVNRQASAVWRSIGMIMSVSVIAFLALYNLTTYPVTWFDEGLNLQVPKALVRFGEYAIYNNESFQYHGVSTGPTVILPIAAAFWLFGIGLLQARMASSWPCLASARDSSGGYCLSWLP